MESFVSVKPESDFPLANLPWGVFRTNELSPRIGVAIGDFVVDVKELSVRGLLSSPELSKGAFLQQETLNSFMAQGKSVWKAAREDLTRLLSKDEGVLRDNKELMQKVFLPMADVEMLLPATIGDYSDAYASRHHASNVGEMFRGKDHALAENWIHLPVGYHSRASSVVVSGTPVRRPRGQICKDGKTPMMSACNNLDFELEVACFIGSGNALGECIPVEQAKDHIFGYVLLNDWSARDIQKWESVPLGPFNAKNWVTQISPWVVTPDALEPFLCAATDPQVSVLPYLDEPSPRVIYDVKVAVDLVLPGCTTPVNITSSNLNYMYWTFPQMIAHHTFGGCNLRPGDLIGSGTISGPLPHERACLLELTRNGTKPLQLEVYPQEAGASATVERGYLEDGDTVVLRGHCIKEGHPRIGFGSCSGTVLAAYELPTAL